MKEKIEYIIEYKSPGKYFYARSTTAFSDKKIALITAKYAKKMAPKLGVRVIQQKRKIIKVCKL